MKNFVGAAALVCAFPVVAEEAEKPFQLEAELGVLSITGNTESSSVKSKIDIKHDMTHWRNSYLLEGLYKKDKITEVDISDPNNPVESKREVVGAEKYFASAQADYKLNEEHRGLFVYASYLDDKFSGYEYQATIAAGYSDQLFQTDTSFLRYSIGPGMSFLKVEDKDGVEGESEDYAVVRVSMLYEYKFNENAKFTQALSSDIAVDSDDNTKTKSETAISAKLNNSLALKVSYTILHNSEVPVGIEKKDAETAVTLVYSF